MPFALIRDRRILLDVNKKAAISEDSIFCSAKCSPHCNVLKKWSEMMNNEAKIIPLWLLYTLTRQTHSQGTCSKSENASLDHRTTSAIVQQIRSQFFSLTSKKLSLNLCSEPVKNLKTEYLYDRMLECLDKESELSFEIVPIIMDCHSTNVKVMKKMLKLTNPVTN